MRQLGNHLTIAIVGATGTGKSSLADACALKLGGELVSADSIQVYKGMDIGTAKTPQSQRSVPYHCIDLVEPDFPFTAALYQRSSRRVIESLIGQGKPAIVCGGTGLYVRAALDDFRFDENRELYGEIEAEVLADIEDAASKRQEEARILRQRLTSQAEEMGVEAFHALLTQRDPDSAALIHPNNVRRVIRAFEFLEQGSSYAEQHGGFESFKSVYPTQFIGITVDHDVLYRVVENRVDKMLSSGLLDEVDKLVSAGYADAPAIQQAIGYKELIPVLDGMRSLDEAVAEIKQSTRRYAKRQRTWFKRDPRIEWIDATEEHKRRLTGEMSEAEFTENLLCRTIAILSERQSL